MIEQKGMPFDHDFGYSFPLFSSHLKKREEEKEKELAKIVIKTHAFQTGPQPFSIITNWFSGRQIDDLYRIFKIQKEY